MWRVLSDPTRRRILDVLRQGPRNTTELCDAIPEMSRHGVIKHLKALDTARLIRVERRGRERLNHLNATPLREIYQRWLSPYEAVWAGRLTRLTRAAGDVEEEPMPHPGPVRVVETVQQDRCSAEPAHVWDVLTGRIGDWWNEPYVPPSSQGTSLELRPGGVLWDDRGDGNGYVLGIVRGCTQPRELVLDGDFGVPGAIHGRLVVTIDQTPPGSTITFSHTAIGAIPDGGDDDHREGWAELLARVCALAEPTDR